MIKDKPLNKDKPNRKEEIISVINAATELGMRKQTLFKKLKRLKIKPFKEKSENHRGQSISFIQRCDLDLIKKQEIQSSKNSKFLENKNYEVEGYFYLIQLEPEFDKGRFKVGFAKNVSE